MHRRLDTVGFRTAVAAGAVAAGAVAAGAAPLPASGPPPGVGAFLFASLPVGFYPFFGDVRRR